MNLPLTLAGLAAVLTLAACTEGIEGTTSYAGPNSVIATNVDKGTDQGSLDGVVPGIAYTPDGCQVLIIDDGVEGYADNRYDPVTGLPVCNDRYPPGTVVGPYHSGTEGIRDQVPGSSGRRVVVRK